jgi:hypothetical protein
MKMNGFGNERLARLGHALAAVALGVFAAGMGPCPAPTPECGNDICEPGETDACDDCRSPPVCGNGVCEAGEGDACLDCTPDATCGDGWCDPGESSATCGGDCPAGPVCGNAWCEPGESSATCAADCTPPPACGNGICEIGESSGSCSWDCGCASHADCGATELCVWGACEAAYGRTYWVGAANAEFSSYDPSCSCSWDGDGSAPDGCVDIYVDGAYAATTPTVSDSWYPVWNQGINLTLEPWTRVDFDVLDHDPVGYDVLMSGYVDAPTMLAAARGDGWVWWCGSYADLTSDWCFWAQVLAY